MLLIFLSRTQVGIHKINLHDYSYGILILLRRVEYTTLILSYFYILWFTLVHEIKL